MYPKTTYLSWFQEMSADVYSLLLKALAMSDNKDITCYPVRVSAAGAISELLEVSFEPGPFTWAILYFSSVLLSHYAFLFVFLQNDYLPPEWLPLLQAVIGRIGTEDEENIILFQLLRSIVEAGNENVAVHVPDIVLSIVGSILELMHPSLDPWPQVCVNSASTVVCHKCGSYSISSLAWKIIERKKGKV